MPPTKHLRLASALIFATALSAANGVAAQEGVCGSLSNFYGPFDYRTDRRQLPIVEKHHFSTYIENLTNDPHDGSHFGAHLAYTLAAFPNHHRALASVSRYAVRTRSPQPPNLTYSVDCYYERALRFRPDDSVARLLFADHLIRTQRPQGANAHVDYVRDSVSDNPLTHYNLGLLYVQLGRYDDALKQAHLAKALGMQRDGLKQQLMDKGRWAEPAAAAPSDSASGPDRTKGS